MGKNVEATEEVAVQEVQEETSEQEVTIVAELSIRVLSNGGIELNVPEDKPQLQPQEIEALTRNVFEQLRDTRIAQTAVEMFKARLG